MSANNTTDGDGLQQLVRALGEALYNDPGETPLPMATADPTEVIHAQLTENTGTHFLDSGMDNGRHWQQNQETPPWEQPAFSVNDGFVTHNVADFMERTFDRDDTCVALEAALYAFGQTGDREGDPWSTCAEAFAQTLLDGTCGAAELRDMGVPEGFIPDVLAVQDEIRADRHSIASRRDGPTGPMRVNTYNGSEWHGLSQVLMATNLGGPYADYVFLQVHQGADVRGGYTGPRVYSVWDGWIPMELSYSCLNCDWNGLESTLGYDNPALLYQPEVDAAELYEALRERTDDEIPSEEVKDYAEEQADAAREDDHTDGAVFHIEKGCGGIVRF